MSEIAKLITDYGIAIVAIAALIFVIFITEKRIRESQEKSEARLLIMTENSEKQLSNLAKLIIDNSPKVHTGEEEEENRNLSHMIDTQLNILLIQTNANRVSFFEYHNGGYGVTGRSFQKMSVMNEKVDANTQPLMKSYQNLPRRMYPILIDELAEKGECFFDDISQVKEKDPVSYYWWTARNAKAVYIKTIVDNINAVCLGFITVEYLYDFCQDSPKTKLILSKATQRLGGVLQVEKIADGGGNE